MRNDTGRREPHLKLPSTLTHEVHCGRQNTHICHTHSAPPSSTFGVRPRQGAPAPLPCCPRPPPTFSPPPHLKSDLCRVPQPHCFASNGVHDVGRVHHLQRDREKSAAGSVHTCWDSFTPVWIHTVWIHTCLGRAGRSTLMNSTSSSQPSLMPARLSTSLSRTPERGKCGVAISVELPQLSASHPSRPPCCA